MKKTLSGNKNLEGILICVCVDAANKSCRWQAQSLQQYNTGPSRCKAVIIFRAPHTEGNAAFFVRPRVRDGIRLHPQRFRVEHQARLERHEYIATSGPRLRQPPPKQTNFIFRGILKKRSGPSSVVGTVTAYGLDVPEIESRWGRDFLYLSRPALWPTQPPVQWAPGLSLGQGAAGA
jgi:hypothetical protein